METQLKLVIGSDLSGYDLKVEARILIPDSIQTLPKE